MVKLDKEAERLLKDLKSKGIEWVWLDGPPHVQDNVPFGAQQWFELKGTNEHGWISVNPKTGEIDLPTVKSNAKHYLKHLKQYQPEEK